MKKLFCISALVAICAPLWAQTADDCAKCHELIASKCAAAGKATHHRLANRKIGGKLDDEAFSASPVSHFDLQYKFLKEGEKYKIEVFDKSENAVQIYAPAMSLGVTPLIQYVVDAQRGAKQVMSMAYDTDKKEWFDVFGDENRKRGEWGHWQSRGMNWNSNCAYCHVTNFKKNYDFKTDSYKSAWAADGVTCIQCHPALPADCGHKELPLLAEGLTRVQHMHNCAACHSRREELTSNKFKAGDDYFDFFRPELPVNKGTYYADGKVRDEDFMFGSFSMCRQYLAGVVCGDCHDWHSMNIYKGVDKNQLCLQCHAPAAKNFKGAPTIDPHAHSFHKDNDGNLCVNCHMPKTFYMQRDSRYDHGFTSPDPYLTKVAGIPNACSQCHEKIDADKPERTADWLLEKFESQYGSERFLRKRARAVAVAKAHEGDTSQELKAELLRLARLDEIAAWQATLVSLLSTWIGDADVYNFTLQMLDSQSPQVRSAAVSSLSMRGDSGVRIGAMLKDKSAVVRIDSAFSLASILDKNSSEYKELLDYLDFNTDRPIGALKRADLALRRGDFDNAKTYAMHALKLEKLNPSLYREVGIMLFKARFESDAAKVLSEAKARFKDADDISYTLALLYAETGKTDLALAELKETVRINPNFARAWYNMSVVYSQKGDGVAAMEALDKAAALDTANAQAYKEAREYYQSLIQPKK